MAHPATSGTAYTVLATLVQLMGEDKAFEYLAKLKSNVSQFTKSGAAAPNAVALGEDAIAITFSHDQPILVEVYSNQGTKRFDVGEDVYISLVLYNVRVLA